MPEETGADNSPSEKGMLRCMNLGKIEAKKPLKRLKSMNLIVIICVTKET